MIVEPTHPYIAVAEHVGFSPTRRTLLARIKRETEREVLGESPKGWAASYSEALARRPFFVKWMNSVEFIEGVR